MDDSEEEKENGKLEETIPESKHEDTPRIWTKLNWIGILAGILTIIMPFMGTWWHVTLGTGPVGAMGIGLSPFGVETIIFGKAVLEEMVGSPLIFWFLLGLKLGVVYLGVVILAGSLLSISNRRKALADQFIRFGSGKLLWLVVVFTLMLLIIIIIANHLPEASSSFVGNVVPFQGSLPYLVGEGEMSAEMGILRFSSPIRMEFTNAYAVAVIAAVLGVVSRFYQKRVE